MLGAAAGKAGISQAASVCASLVQSVQTLVRGHHPNWHLGGAGDWDHSFFTPCQWCHRCFPWPETPAAGTKLGVGLWHSFQEEKEGQEARGALEQ